MAWAVLFSAVLSCLCARASLVEQSPFLPPGYGQAITPPPPQRPLTSTATLPSLQLRGVMSLNGDWMLSLQDERSGRSEWVEVNGSAMGVDVISYDASSRSAMIRSQGQVMQISLVEENGVSASSLSRDRKGSSLSLNSTTLAAPAKEETISFEKLNPRLQALYSRPENAKMLLNSGIRIPSPMRDALSAQVQVESADAQQKNRGLDQASRTNAGKKKGPFTQPSITNALTEDEKIQRRIELGLQ